MTDFTLSKRIFSGKKRAPSTSGNLASRAVRPTVLFGMARLLSLVAHAPGIYEHLMKNGRTVAARTLRLA